MSEQHQHRPQRQGHRQQGEGQRILPVRITVKEKGTVEQHHGHAHFQAKARVGNKFRMKHPAQHVLLQIPEAEACSREAHGNVVPAQAESFSHQASRDEYAERHRRQKQRSQERYHCGGIAERTPGIQDIVERVSSPAQLPGAEVVLPGLLVEVSENQKEQQGYHGRHYQQTNCDAVHGAKQLPQPE